MTSKIFDEAAASWDEKPGRIELSNKIAAAIRQAVSLRRDMDALEIGCGTGLLTLQLAPELRSICATDSSQGMLAVLQQKINSQALANVTALHADLTVNRSALGDKSVDLLYSAMTLHHIKDTEAILLTCYEHLKPGGILAIADLEQEDGSFHGDMPGVEHLGFEPDKLAELASGCGFRNAAISRAHVIRKEVAAGQMRDFPVFLMTAEAVK